MTMREKVKRSPDERASQLKILYSLAKRYPVRVMGLKEIERDVYRRL